MTSLSGCRLVPLKSTVMPYCVQIHGWHSTLSCLSTQQKASEIQPEARSSSRLHISMWHSSTHQCLCVQRMASNVTPSSSRQVCVDEEKQTMKLHACNFLMALVQTHMKRTSFVTKMCSITCNWSQARQKIKKKSRNKEPSQWKNKRIPRKPGKASDRIQAGFWTHHLSWTLSKRIKMKWIRI